jgi:hypothetical protein
LQGLFAMVMSYIIAGELRVKHKLGPAPYPKFYSPLLGKTNLGEIFEQMSSTEQALFADVGSTLKAMGYGGTEGEYVFPAGYHMPIEGADPNVIHYGPKRGEWIKSIAAGMDQFAGFDDVKWPAPGMSNMHLEQVGKEPKIGNRKLGAITEMRRMEQHLPVDNWSQAALEVFDMIREING